MTQADKIRELEALANTLDERVNNVRKDLVDRARFAVVELQVTQIEKGLNLAREDMVSKDKLALLEQRFARIEEQLKSRSALLTVIAVAFIGPILTLIGQAIIKAYLPGK